jgi:hypothetical protein
MSKPITVFISYEKESNENDAKALKKCLEDTGTIEVKLALEEREHATENAERIARLIDSSHYFIVFYTRGKGEKSGGRYSQWVNQELGYAFNHVNQYGLNIIPIYHLRDDFAGFLTSQTNNFYRGFELGDDEISKEKCFKEVKEYLTGEYEHPIEIELVLQSLQSGGNKFYKRGILTITNNSPKILSHGRLDIVIPKEIEVWYEKNELTKTKLTPRPGIRPVVDLGALKSTEFFEEIVKSETDIIPKPLQDKYDLVEPVQKTGIKRISFPLEDIYGLNAYNFVSDFRFNDVEEFNFGIHVTVPFFGTTFYEGFISSSKTQSENCLVNKNRMAESIRIRVQKTGS